LIAVPLCLSAAESQQLFLTIYNRDLALVEDQRTLNVSLGHSRLEFKDVSASIRPETVSLVAPDLSIVEQNFDFDLLTPAKLIEKAVGQKIQIVRINPGNGSQVTETATVLSVNDGVVLDVGGRIEVLRADSIPTRVIFDKIPENLRAHPTLSITVDSKTAGSRSATLSYLTTGLSWDADYVGLFDEKANQLDLQGWITLTNKSGTTFNDVALQLVAGDIGLIRSRDDEYSVVHGTAKTTKGAKQDERHFNDYYIYPVAEHTTVADNQSKQIGFLDVKGIKASKSYLYVASSFRSSETQLHASVVVNFSNTGASGLGSELPAGMVRVYVRDADGKPKYVGESAIDHTPQGSDLAVTTGEAFDVTVQPTLVKEDKLGHGRVRNSMEYVIHNSRKDPIEITIRQASRGAELKLVSESIKSNRVDASTLEWKIPVPPGDETKLSFTAEMD
jgi:hypothetical protein